MHFQKDILNAYLCRSSTTSPIIAQLIEIYLRQVPQHSGLDLYGCGSVAKALTQLESRPLENFRTRFIQTTPCDLKSFCGYPVISPAEAVSDPAPQAILLSHVAEKAMRNCLRGYSGTICGIKQIVNSVSSSFMSAVIMNKDEDRISRIANEIQHAAKGKPVVIFFSSSLALHSFKILREIKGLGYAIVLCPENTNVTSEITIFDYADRDYFDYTFAWKTFFPAEAAMLISMIKPAFVHAEIGVWSSFSLALTMAETNARVITEYRDIYETIFDSPHKYSKFLQTTPDEHALEEKARKYIYTKSAGIIFKEAEEAIDFLQKEKSYTSQNSLQYLPYLSDAYASLPCKKGTGKGIVHAGALSLNPEWHSFPLVQSLLEAGKTIAEQGIHFTIYNASNATAEECREFVNADRDLPCFHYKKALPYEQIVRELSEYDYAFFCFDYSRGLERHIYTRTTFGSRIFTYLEAGLPILISPEIKWMAEIVRQMGIGIPCKYSELKNIKRILSDDVRKAILKRMPDAQERWSHKQNIHRLAKFYTKIIT